MIGFRSTVQGLLPILPSRVRRIGIFCLTHKCCHVLLPAGSIRSSSLVSRYEDCFKPMALQVPAYPLRPYGSSSGFSGSYRCTIDAKLAEIAFHRATVESQLTPWGPLHLPLMGLLQCQFGDCWGWCTPTSWDTKLRFAQTSRAFSHWECLILGPCLAVDFSDGGKREE